MPGRGGPATAYSGHDRGVPIPRMGGGMSLAGAAPSGLATGALVLADISGYTGFLEAVSAAHYDDIFGGGAVPAAYPLISTLLDGIIGRLHPPFRLAKLEGDAVFA